MGLLGLLPGLQNVSNYCYNSRWWQQSKWWIIALLVLAPAVLIVAEFGPEKVLLVLFGIVFCRVIAVPVLTLTVRSVWRLLTRLYAFVAATVAPFVAQVDQWSRRHPRVAGWVSYIAEGLIYDLSDLGPAEADRLRSIASTIWRLVSADWLATMRTVSGTAVIAALCYDRAFVIPAANIPGYTAVDLIPLNITTLFVVGLTFGEQCGIGAAIVWYVILPISTRLYNSASPFFTRSYRWVRQHLVCVTACVALLFASCIVLDSLKPELKSLIILPDVEISEMLQAVTQHVKTIWVEVPFVNGEPYGASYWAAINAQRPEGCENYQECHVVTIFKKWAPPAIHMRSLTDVYWNPDFLRVANLARKVRVAHWATRVIMWRMIQGQL